MESPERLQCDICGVLLIPPYVVCKECDPLIRICRLCFSKGSENQSHRNDHSYSVYREDFPLFESSAWTAAEELRLLDALIESGYGNWVDVAKFVRTKDATECSRHYERYYVLARHEEALLPRFSHGIITAFPSPLICRYGEQPPRPAQHSLLLSDMAGYMPARSDFATEYDNYAELDLKTLEFSDSDDEVGLSLKATVLRVYNDKLKERHRRKKIIRDLGLIGMQQVAQTNRRYGGCLKTRQLETLKKLWRLLKPLEADMLMESLIIENELRRDIRMLQRCRAHGLRRLDTVAVFETVKSRRDGHRKRRHHLSDIVSRLQDKSACQRWLMSQPAVAAASGKSQVPLIRLPSAPRKAAPPLDVTGLPGFELLSVREQEVCSNVRLMPKAYLEFKRILVSESKKLGSLRLAQARELIKIDVNKTRKLFDFLSAEGFIVKES